MVFFQTFLLRQLCCCDLCIPSLRGLRQNNHHELEGHQGYKVRPCLQKPGSRETAQLVNSCQEDLSLVPKSHWKRSPVVSYACTGEMEIGKLFSTGERSQFKPD